MTGRREVDVTDTSTQERALTAPQRIPGTPNADAEAPKVARSGNNVFVLWHEFPPGFDPNNPQPDVYLARSTDQGVTFHPRINLSGSPTVFSGDEDIAVSGSRVYVVWVEGGDIVFRRDRENDGTFSNRITLSDATTGTGPTVPRVVASGNNVFVVWQAELNGHQDVFYTRSTNAGDSFQARTNVSANNGDSLGPDMTLISDNRVLIAWRDDSGGQGAEIFYVRGQ